MRWPRPSSLMPKPTYLSSREAQQMSESELERELHRRGQELMRRLLQGHLDQRTPGEAAGPVEGVDDVERSQRRLQERHPETTFGTVQVARPGGWRSSMAPRRSSTSRAPPSTLRCGNRPHPRGRVRLQGGACVPSPPASSKGRAVPGPRPRWSSLVHAGATQYRCFIHARVRIRRVANLVGAEAILKLRVLRSQPRPRCVLGLPRRGSTSGTNAQRYADAIARPVSKPPPPPPHHAFDGSSSSCRAAGRSPLGRRRRRAAPFPIGPMTGFVR